MIGGNDNTLFSASKIIGYRSNSDSKWAYSMPFGCSAIISLIDIGSDAANGVNLMSPLTALTVNGGASLAKSWTPIEALLQPLPSAKSEVSLGGPLMI